MVLGRRAPLSYPWALQRVEEGNAVADMSSKITAEIMGEEYVIRANASEEHVLTIAREVDEAMRRVAAANPRLSTRQVAVLTALNLGDELAKARLRQRALVDAIEHM